MSDHRDCRLGSADCRLGSANPQSAIRGPKFLLPLCFVLSCSAAPPPAPPAAKTTAGIYYEEQLLPPPPELRLEIVSLDEQISADRSMVTPTGASA